MMTYRGTVTAIHGMLFGVFFLLAVYAMLVELLRRPVPLADSHAATRPSVWQRTYLVITAAMGWAAVLSGTYIVYPWYRAVPAAGADLHSYPKALLLSHANTAALHSIGMEWKEHIAFLAPIAFTMLAYVLCRYGSQIMRYPQLRRLLLAFSATALLATGRRGRRRLSEQGRAHRRCPTVPHGTGKPLRITMESNQSNGDVLGSGLAAAAILAAGAGCCAMGIFYVAGTCRLR